MPMSFIMSKNVEHSSQKTPRELMERFTNFTQGRLKTLVGFTDERVLAK